MAKKRFIVEAEWSGYHGGQRRVCHRTVETLFRAGYEALKSFAFTDGTYMKISVRDAKPRERVKQINGYGTLLRELAMEKWSDLRKSAMKRSTVEGQAV